MAVMLLMLVSVVRRWSHGDDDGETALMLYEGFRLEREVARLANEERYAEALPLAQCVVAIRVEALGPELPAVVTSLSNLAAIYEKQGRYAQAEAFLARVVAISKMVLGSEECSARMRDIVKKTTSLLSARRSLPRRRPGVSRRCPGARRGDP